ncbi:MAG: molybdopterin molybdotransferase MoeA [Thermoplasmata archaeon]
MEFKTFISLEDAILKAKKYAPRISHEKIPVLKAVGKYSMEEVKSPHDFPKNDRSAMDGYAIDSNETISASKTNPATFTIKGELFPSSRISIAVGKGEAVRIMTGAPVPSGTNAVVMMEDTKQTGDLLEVFSPVRPLQNVSRKGEDMMKGITIVKRGEKVNPSHVAALYECGIKEISVCSLSVGIISTGDEIVSGDVVNSTQPLLISYFERMGFKTKGYGAVQDDIEKIKRKLDSIKEDVIIVTGGTGPGEKDYLPYVVEKNGKYVFRGLKIRPGRTTSFAIVNGKPVFTLSGLPVAALVASENLIIRVIEKWFDLIPGAKEIREGVLQRSVVNALGFKSFVRVKVEDSGGKMKVIPSRITGSGVIYSVIDADGIMVIDENLEGVEEGQLVKVEMLRW